MSTPVSIIYLTYRPDPKFAWFADSLARQVSPGAPGVDVVLVDGAYTAARTVEFSSLVNGRFRFTHVPPKPTPYAGSNRLTTRDFFAAASARNTGVLHTTAPYVVFVDDLSVLMPGWWEEIQRAAADGVVLGGAYQKHHEMVVDDGVLLSSRCEPGGVDSRWDLGRDDEWVSIAGGQLFGCSFGAPRALLIEVNGFDEICDTIGGEDWHFGVRIEWTGATIRYSRRMLTIECEELHHVGSPALRIDKKAPPTEYVRRLREFGVTKRYVDGNWDSSHMILDVLFGTGSTQTQGNYYLLSTLQPDAFGTLPRRFPRRHWFDRQPLTLL